MGFLDLNFDEVFEPKALTQGEYQLRVIDAGVKTSSKGKGDYLGVRLEVMNEPTAKTIQHVMMLPSSNDDIKKKNNRLFAIQSFIKACGMDPGANFNPEQLVGSTCWAILTEEADPEYGNQNRVRKFVAGK